MRIGYFEKDVDRAKTCVADNILDVLKVIKGLYEEMQTSLLNRLYSFILFFIAFASTTTGGNHTFENIDRKKFKAYGYII